MTPLHTVRSRIVAAVAVVALLLTGCTPQTEEDTGGGNTAIWMGDLPAPAALAPDADYASYQKLGARALSGGEKGLAAWEALLLRAGVAIDGSDGAPLSANGDSGMGMPMSDAELRLTGSLAAVGGGLPLTTLADVLGSALDMSADDVAAQLYAELQKYPDPGFAQAYSVTGPGLTANGALLAVDEVQLSWAQVELITRRFAAEAGVAAIEKGEPQPAALATPPGGAAVVTPALAMGSARRACQNSENPWSQEILNQAGKAHASFVFDKLVDYLAGEASNVGSMITVVRAMLAWASLAAKVATMQARFVLKDAPLVRTKDTTPGEVRDLEVTYTYDPGKYETFRECVNLFLSPLGFELPGAQPDPPSGIDVRLMSDDPSELRVGDGTGTQTQVDQAQTDSDGRVVFKLSGAPQAERIPDKAAPDDITVGVRTVVDLKSNDFWKDLASLPWDVSDASSTGGLSLVPELLSRAQLLAFSAKAPVRDWKLNADFQVTGLGTVSERTAIDVTYACGGIASHNRSTEEKGTFTADAVDVTAKLISDDIGVQAWVFVPQGKEFSGYVDQVNGVLMFPMPAHYEVAKSTESPGTGDMPDHATDASGCTGGGGGGGGHSSNPPEDCGVRDYDSTLEVTIPEPRTLYAWGDHASLTDGKPLWSHCGDGIYPTDPVVAPPRNACSSPKISGGDIPSLADVADPSVTHFSVEGSLSCRDEEAGTLHTVDYTWTLDFCRLNADGKPSPDC